MRFLEVTIPLHPGDIALNRAWRRTKKGVKRSSLYRETRRLVAQELRMKANLRGITHFERPDVWLCAFWSGHDEGDVDSIIKGSLDALQDCKLLDDDIEVCRLVVDKEIGCEEPEIFFGIYPRGSLKVKVVMK